MMSAFDEGGGGANLITSSPSFPFFFAAFARAFSSSAIRAASSAAILAASSAAAMSASF